jgi:curved DNA-binding protein
LAVSYRDYYKTLGVPKTATEKEIKAAYRKLARKHHPDMNPGKKEAEARFKEINEAHEVLSDPEKRRRYDALGENWRSFESPHPGGRPGSGRVRVNMEDVEDLGGFSDFFKTIFGGGGFQAQGGRGFDPGMMEEDQDAESEVELTLEEVAKGTTRTLEASGPGPKRRVEVKIPPGVREGSRVRVPGEGRMVNRKGDLYLRVHIAPHPLFKPKGDDLEAPVSVPLTVAVLGGEAQVPTLDGPVGIKVPAGTPVGRVFRLRGHGLWKPGKGTGRGDLLATLSVAVPQNLTKRERELFEELRTSGR